MKAFLLAAGRGMRFRPVTDRVPKALVPFLNIPLLRAHLTRLFRQGIREAGINLHHLGDEVESHLRDRSTNLPELTLFREDLLLGTAGALKNAAGWLGREDFLVVNCDAVLEFSPDRLAQAHSTSGRVATLLVAPNREPRRYTPLQTEGDLITGFGGETSQPLLYTGVCVLSPQLLLSVPSGETSLVTHVWEPMLARGEKIGYVLHDGAFSDLGSPGDFLRASLEALARGGPFPAESGFFDEGRRTLSRVPIADFEIRSSVLGDVQIGAGARVSESAVWDGVQIGARARLERCLVAGGRVPPGSHYRDALLWTGQHGLAVARPLEFSA